MARHALICENMRGSGVPRFCRFDVRLENDGRRRIFAAIASIIASASGMTKPIIPAHQYFRDIHYRSHASSSKAAYRAFIDPASWRRALSVMAAAFSAYFRQAVAHRGIAFDARLRRHRRHRFISLLISRCRR